MQHTEDRQISCSSNLPGSTCRGRITRLQSPSLQPQVRHSFRLTSKRSEDLKAAAKRRRSKVHAPVAFRPHAHIGNLNGRLTKCRNAASWYKVKVPALYLLSDILGSFCHADHGRASFKAVTRPPIRTTFSTQRLRRPFKRQHVLGMTCSALHPRRSTTADVSRFGMREGFCKIFQLVAPVATRLALTRQLLNSRSNSLDIRDRKVRFPVKRIASAAVPGRGIA